MTSISRGVSFAIITAVYIIAFFCGFVVYSSLLPYLNPLSAFFAADAAATIIVWISGLICGNASMYDPYWSAGALALVILFAAVSNFFNAAIAIYLVIFAFWGIRLTVNWALNWSGLSSQDWRYSMLKEKSPRLWLITNFFGINFMPTLLVFVNLIPAYFAINAGGSANAITFSGAAVCIAAAIIQTISDAQMLKFRSVPSNKGKPMQAGLWRYSRHPNYLGEVSFWWGVWIIQISVLPNVWWTVLAPVLMTCLFVFISIPMMEKKLLAAKEGYTEYKKATSMLMPLPPLR